MSTWYNQQPTGATNNRKPSSNTRKKNGSRDIESYSIPREYYDRAMAFLQQPRTRPVRKPPGSRRHIAASADTEPIHRTCKRMPLLVNGRFEAGTKVLARCQRIQRRSVFRIRHDDDPLDDYPSVGMTAMLSTISSCIKREDWHNAVKILSVALQQNQSEMSRHAVLRFAFITLVYNPILRHTDLLATFLQGVFGVPNIAEMKAFLQLCTYIPSNVPRGELDPLELRRVRSDKRRLATLDPTNDSNKTSAEGAVDDGQKDYEALLRAGDNRHIRREQKHARYIYDKYRRIDLRSLRALSMSALLNAINGDEKYCELYLAGDSL